MERRAVRRAARRAEDSADEAKDRAREADLDGPLVHWREKGHRVEYLGTEDVDGTPAHKLRVTRKDGDTQYVYLDPDYWLEIRVVTVSRVRGVERVTETDLGGYAQVAGVWIPFSIESGPKGRPPRERVTIGRPRRTWTSTRLLSSSRRRAGDGPPDRRGPERARAVASCPRPPKRAARAVDRRRRPLRARRAQHRLGDDERPHLGPRRAQRGRQDDVFVGAASGGVWKSHDGGTTFKPVFDKQPVQSIGAIAIDPSNPSTVWVGTGESLDAQLRLGRRRHLQVDRRRRDVDEHGPARVRAHRADRRRPEERRRRLRVRARQAVERQRRARRLQDDATAARPGALVLKGANLSTGCSGLAMDPKNPDVLFAGLWDFRRKGWTFRSGGDGPDAPSGSGLFRTDDGGKTWTPLDRRGERGLPAGPWGRVEVAIAPSDAKRRVRVHRVGRLGALPLRRRRPRRGRRATRARTMVWRPFYFARLVVDPTNPDRVFKPGVDLIVSEDGGAQLPGSTRRRPHGDWHDVWIDPDNPQARRSAATTAASGSRTTAAAAGGRRTTCRSRSSTT